MKKTIRIMLIAVAVFAAIFLLSWLLRFDRGEPAWGITWSEFRAREELELPDPEAAYLAALDGLKPKKVQLIGYWQYLEPKEGEWDFSYLDRELEEAAARGMEVTLVVGRRVPRWPECHIPAWAKGLATEEFEGKLFHYLTTFVERYHSSPAVVRWQVENEPLLSLFGDCTGISRDLLRREVALVKSLDPAREIMVTDSGEMSLWMRTSGVADMLGTTMYRVVWNKYWGWYKHFYPPAWYTLRAALVKLFTPTKEVIVSELQAEPWPRGGASILNYSLEEQIDHFGPDVFKENVEFARRTGFKEIYLWGAEWWYWRKVHGDPSFWDAGRELLNGK